MIIKTKDQEYIADLGSTENKLDVVDKNAWIKFLALTESNNKTCLKCGYGDQIIKEADGVYGIEGLGTCTVTRISCCRCYITVYKIQPSIVSNTIYLCDKSGVAKKQNYVQWTLGPAPDRPVNPFRRRRTLGPDVPPAIDRIRLRD